jgi:hypothetical protein
MNKKQIIILTILMFILLFINNDLNAYSTSLPHPLNIITGSGGNTTYNDILINAYNNKNWKEKVSYKLVSLQENNLHRIFMIVKNKYNIFYGIEKSYIIHIKQNNNIIRLNLHNKNSIRIYYTEEDNARIYFYNRFRRSILFALSKKVRMEKIIKYNYVRLIDIYIPKSCIRIYK